MPHNLIFMKLVEKCYLAQYVKYFEKINLDTNTPGTKGGPGGRYRTLAVKFKEKTPINQLFFVKIKKNYLHFFCIYLLLYQNIGGKQIFTHRSFPEVGQKQKT